MEPNWTKPLLGVLLAVGITSTMDATGLSAFSALPLLPLTALFWYWERFSRREIGMVGARQRDFALALLYPLAVLGALALIALTAGAGNLAQTDWRKAAARAALVAVSTTLAAIITEEGFFRGWLWASLQRRRLQPRQVLLWTSLAFAVWHVSAVVLPTGFDLPPAQLPVFLPNVLAIGAIWGMLRMISGSVIVASLSHGLWNGLVYVLFGFGTRTGALGIQQTWLYGPEVGILGLTLNVLFAALLWMYAPKLMRPAGDRHSPALAGTAT